MKTIIAIAAAAFMGVLSSCTINPHQMDMTQAVQSARTRTDHESLAKHYDDAAKEMQVKAAEHKKLLAQYQFNKAIYGKQAQSLISHCQGLVRVYEQAAAENDNTAKSHRLMAAEVK